MELDEDQLALLIVLADAQRALSKGQHEEFITSSSREGLEIADASGAVHPFRLADLTELHRHGFVSIQYNRSGNPIGTVTRAGLKHVEDSKKAGEAVSNDERALLSALLRQAIEQNDAVRAHAFRRDHVRHRQLIDALIEKEWIDRDGDFYRVDRRGLLALDTVDAQMELIAAEKVAAHLAEMYWLHPVNHTFRVPAVAEAIGMSTAAFSRAIRVLARVPGPAAIAGWGGDENGHLSEVRISEGIADITAESIRAPEAARRRSSMSSLSIAVDRQPIFDALQQFDVGEPLGLGANGAVYEGRDRHLGRDVALKFLNISKEALLGTKAQAAAQAKVQHPNVLPIYALGRARNPLTGDESECIVMELVREATTLQDWMGPGNLSLDEALRVAHDVLKGLSAIHAHQLVHGDIHPDNVLLDRQLLVRVIDLHYLEERARGSTATRAWLIAVDCRATTTMLKGLLAKTSLDDAVLTKFVNEARAATNLDDIASALRKISTGDTANIAAAPTPHRPQRLRALLDANRIPAVVLSSTASTRHDQIRRVDYAISVHQLDSIAIIDASVTYEGVTRALPNLVRQRGDQFTTSLGFDEKDSASRELHIQLKLNSGEMIRYGFALDASWGGALTTERLSISLVTRAGVVETIED